MTPEANYDDDESHLQQMQTYLLSELLLIKELHGILSSVVSNNGFEGLEVFISAELATLGLKLRLVSPTLYCFDECDTATLERSVRTVSRTLELLDGLVTEDLAKKYNQLLPNKTMQMPAGDAHAIRNKHPSLTLLYDVIAICRRTNAIDAGGTSHSNLGNVPSMEELDSYLTFGMGIADQDCLLENLESLNRDVDQIVSATRSRASRKLRKVENIEEEGEDVVFVQQAQEYRQQISNLYKFLSSSMDCCKEKHMAQLCLTNFGIDKNNLDIYISVRNGLEDMHGGNPITWHPTKCSKRDLPGSGTIVNNLCEILNAARDRQLEAVITYSNEALSADAEERANEDRRLKEDDLRWSFVDLGAVLETSNTAKEQEQEEDSRLNVEDKIRLQCLLTQSLLFLHPSFWMPESLELQNIHFLTRKSKFNLKNPYIYCAFKQSITDYIIPDIDMIGRVLPLTMDEQKKRFGHELALTRYMKMYSKSIQSHLGEVLHECLWFKACIAKIPHSKMALDLKIRYAVSLYLLKPLIGSLEFNWPNVAKEILPYSMERQGPLQKGSKVIARDQKRKQETVHTHSPSLDNTTPGKKFSNCLTSSSTSRKMQQAINSRAVKRQQYSWVGSGQDAVHEMAQSPRSMFEVLGVSSHTYDCFDRQTSAMYRPFLTRDDNLELVTLAQDYTVGWISAIPLEKAIACEMLDQEYPKEIWPWYDVERDHNSYTFGRLHGHNVVVACLHKGRYGTNSAAVVARDMHWSFSKIKIGLLVGIAGGAPSDKHDIRLGDVVVSSPTDRYPGVIQYDFGKALSQHEFAETAHMTPPSQMLLTSLANLEARHKSKGHRIDEIVKETLAKNQRIKHEYSRPPGFTDRLYKSNYEHSQDGQCECLQVHESVDNMSRVMDNSYSQASRSDATLKEQPSQNELIRTARIDDTDMTCIFYGLVASANRLMKDVVARDALVKQYDVLCFEMEAAGIANSYPYVVIRGICDYSDSHKNKRWQAYAAANAAAYAKELLGIIPCHVSRDV